MLEWIESSDNGEGKEPRPSCTQTGGRGLNGQQLKARFFQSGCHGDYTQN